jgi:hypothetical protein
MDHIDIDYSEYIPTVLRRMEKYNFDSCCPRAHAFERLCSDDPPKLRFDLALGFERRETRALVGLIVYAIP